MQHSNLLGQAPQRAEEGARDASRNDGKRLSPSRHPAVRCSGTDRAADHPLVTLRHDLSVQWLANFVAQASTLRC